MRSLFLVPLFLFLLQSSAPAGENQTIPSGIPPEIKIVRADSGKVFLNDDRTPLQAKAIALNYARRKALEDAVGIDLHSSSLMYNGDLVNELVSTAAKGLIIKEKIQDGCKTDEGGEVYCTAHIEAHVKPLADRPSRIRFLNASVQRPDKGSSVSIPAFQDNDELQVKATLNEDSHLTIFSVDQYGNITKLFPNDYQKSGIIPSRKEFTFPDNSMMARGLRLRVTTPKNLSKAVESVIIIATREEAHFLENTNIEHPTVTDLMKELSALVDADIPWAEKTVGYEVRK